MIKFRIAVLISFTLILLSSTVLVAQTEDHTKDELLHQKLESISENLSSEDADFASLEEHLLFYKDHPLAINTATREQLQQLLILNDIQINNLLNHIEANGPLLSVYELQTIDGFDLPAIYSLMPYISIDAQAINFKETFREGRHTVYVRYQRILENQKGYKLPANSSNSHYLGSADKLYMRYKFNFNNNIMAGFISEKDPGEEFFKGSQKQGFDYYSGHLFIKDIGKLKTLAIGDYELQFGQGLVAWSGLAFGKTSDAIAVKKSGIGIKPHTAAEENLFYRGVAATVQLKNIYLTGFVSRNRIDANVVLDTLNGGGVSSATVQTTGEHATASELIDRHSLQQTIVGGIISLKTNKFEIGLIQQYKGDGKPGSQNDLTNSLFNTGVHYSALLRNFNFFGETATTLGGGSATVNGVLVALDRKISLSLINRNFQSNYRSFMANAFSESTTDNNEKGTYIGLQIKPSSTTSINSFMDLFSFPFSKYLVTGPSYGYDYFTQINYNPNKKFAIYGRFRIKNKLKDLSNIGEINVPVSGKRSNYRVHLSYSVNNNLSLASRVEWLTLDQQNLPKQNGFLIFQDVNIQSSRFPISLTARYALFQTDSYDTRIYAFETDMPLVFSIPAYYYKGSRVYLMVNYQVTHNLSFWVRYSQTFYDNKKVISEGSLNEINGNVKSDIKIELRYTF